MLIEFDQDRGRDTAPEGLRQHSRAVRTQVSSGFEAIQSSVHGAAGEAEIWAIRATGRRGSPSSTVRILRSVASRLAISITVAFCAESRLIGSFNQKSLYGLNDCIVVKLVSDTHDVGHERTSRAPERQATSLTTRVQRATGHEPRPAPSLQPPRSARGRGGRTLRMSGPSASQSRGTSSRSCTMAENRASGSARSSPLISDRRRSR